MSLGEARVAGKGVQSGLASSGLDAMTVAVELCGRFGACGRDNRSTEARAG